MLGLGMQELIIISLICLIIFGSKKLPEIGSGIGKGIVNLKKSIRDDVEKIPAPEEVKESPENKS